MTISEGIAQRQYYSRPDDQKYPTFEALLAAADATKANARTSTIRTRDLRFEAHPDGDKDSPIQIIGTTGIRANLTPWSFAQICTFLKSPADYIRRQDPQLAADLLTGDARRAAIIGPGATEDYGQGFRTDHRLLFDLAGATPTLRAMNSTRYSRLYDSDQLRIVDRARQANPNLDLPPVWEGGRGGAYRSDRDMFCILTDGGTIVPDTTVRGAKDGSMYRGIIVSNSEVGGGCATVRCFWFRTICGNLLLSGIESVIDFSRRHVGGNFTHEVSRALAAAQQWLTRPESEDRKMIDACAQTVIASTKEDTIEQIVRWLKIPESTAQAAITQAEQHEDCNPFSVWGAWQGLTRVSQERAHVADRIDLDLAAATLIRRAKVRVAA